MSVSNTEDGPPGKPPWWHQWVGIVILLGLVGGVVYGVYRLFVLVLENETAGAIVAATIVAAVGLITSIWSNRQLAQQELEQGLRERKREVYVRLLKVLFSSLKIVREKDERKQAEILAEIVSEMGDMVEPPRHCCVARVAA